jgi:chromosome segregation ATPase
MSEDRLDRIENLLEAHGMAMADLRAKQEVTQLHLDRLTQQGIELNTKIDRLAEQSAATDAKLDRLANIVLKIHNRQDDHEDRINRLEQE